MQLSSLKSSEPVNTEHIACLKSLLPPKSYVYF